MKRIGVSIALLFASLGAFAQTGAIQGHSFLGGIQATTQGSKSVNYLDGIVPSAQICVYLTGTQTLATIYKDAINTPLSSCFTSNAVGASNPGGWIFFAATNQGYDIIGSGGIVPNNYLSPVTLCKDCFPSSQFTVSVGVTQIVAGTNISVSSTGPGGTGVVTVNNTASAGGCQGTVSGDNTSTNCGFGNQASNTGTQVTTFGYTNVASNTHNQVTAVGTSNLNQNFGAEVFAGGSTNFTDVLSTNHANDDGLIGIGFSNGVYTDSVSESNAADLTYMGSNNGANITGNNPSEIIGIGQSNVDDWKGASSEIVAIGDSAVDNSSSGTGNTLFGVVGIGDDACSWGAGAQATGQSGDDWVCIGDSAGLDINPGSTDVVMIGDGAGAQNQGTVSVTAVSDVVFIGKVAGKFNQGNDNVGIGDQALSAQTVGAGSGVYNQGNDNIAIGHFPLVANTTGSKNVALGGYAGSDGYLGGTTFGNSNKTGANNTWIGYDSGPNTTSQLSNTAALGYQAHNTASNQAVIGNSSMTQTLLAGITLPITIFSHAGTQLAACAVGIVGGEAVVSDATSLTPGTAYSVTAGAGTDTVRVQCALTGSTYAWQTM